MSVIADHDGVFGMDVRFRPVDDSEMSRLQFLDDDDILLDDAALCLSAADCPGVDTAPAIDVLAAMEASLRECSIVAETGEEQAGLLGAVIAGEYGFSGDTETYDDLANMDLAQVLERRRGIPVSLSIIFIALARRLGWEAGALCAGTLVAKWKSDLYRKHCFVATRQG